MRHSRLWLAVIALVATNLAYADPFPLPIGPYIAAEGGYAFLQRPTGNMSTLGGNASVGGLGWGINAGYEWPLDSYSTIGLELGYADNGSSSYTGSGQTNDAGTLKFESSNADALVTFKTYWTNYVNVFFKAGAAYVMENATSTGPITVDQSVFSSSGSQSNNDWQPMLVAGVGAMLIPNLNTYVSFTYINGDHTNNFSYANGASNPYDDESAAIYSLKVGIEYMF